MRIDRILTEYREFLEHETDFRIGFDDRVHVPTARLQ